MMYPRIEYEMTEDDLAELLDACKPTPVMMIGSYSPPSPQENANRAWKKLGDKMGFDSMTVQPVEGKGHRFFTAVPNETPEAKAEREKHEAAEKRAAEMAKLENEIAYKQDQLRKLKDESPS